jgi:putative salt-induced outer membrane protein YdiY
MILVAAVAFPTTTQADELIFRNGDRLSGKLLRLEGNELLFAAAVVGEVTVKLSEIETLASEQDLELHLSDGSVVTDRVLPAEPGSARLASKRTAPLRLAEIIQINPEPVQWHGSLSAGLTLERGNTDSQQANADFETQLRSDESRIALAVGYGGARQRTTDSEDSETTRRRYYGGAGYDYFLNQKLFWYAKTQAERDGVADLDLRVISGSGLGYQIYDRDDLSLYVALGPSWVHQDYGDDTLDTDYMSAQASWDLKKTLSDAVSFFHNGEWVPSLREFNDNQLLKTQTGIRADLVGDWFGEAKVRWTLNTEPASGKERQDTSYIFGLGWGF